MVPVPEMRPVAVWLSVALSTDPLGMVRVPVCVSVPQLTVGVTVQVVVAGEVVVPLVVSPEVVGPGWGTGGLGVGLCCPFCIILLAI